MSRVFELKCRTWCKQRSNVPNLAALGLRIAKFGDLSIARTDKDGGFVVFQRSLMRQIVETADATGCCNSVCFGAVENDKREPKLDSHGDDVPDLPCESSMSGKQQDQPPALYGVEDWSSYGDLWGDGGSTINRRD